MEFKSPWSREGMRLETTERFLFARVLLGIRFMQAGCFGLVSTSTIWELEQIRSRMCRALHARRALGAGTKWRHVPGFVTVIER